MSFPLIPLAWPPKDADESLDYAVDWTQRLDGDTIASSAWELSGPDDDLTLGPESVSVDLTHTVVWLSEGTVGRKYFLTNHIVTTGNREMEQSVAIRIKAK